jgi:uncharacterized membrane protein required for colicin V production
MNYALDLIIILIAVATIIIYYIKGFVKAVLGFGKVILAVIISSLFGRGLGSFIADRFMNSRITESVYNSISGMYGSEAVTFDMSEILQKTPKALITLAEKCGVNVNELALKYSGDTAASSERLHEFSADIALPISGFVSKILGYVLVFIAAYILLAIAAFFINKIAELPVLHTINKLLGLCLGVACSFIYIVLFVFIANAVIYYIVASGNQAAALEIINKTVIFKFISELKII